MKQWLWDWWPLSLAFVSLGFLFAASLYGDGRHQRQMIACACGYMISGWSFLLIVWYHAYQDMQARHARIRARMEERHRKERERLGIE